MRILVYEELKSKKGIDYSRDHLRRKEKNLEFPPHINLGEGRIAWVEAEIDAWIEQKIHERDNYLPSRQSIDATALPQIADYITASDYDKPPPRRKRGRPPKAVCAPER